MILSVYAAGLLVVGIGISWVGWELFKLAVWFAIKSFEG